MPSNHSTSPITRRQLLQAAGGITFLALAPAREGAFAALMRPAQTSPNPPPLPLFTALPYLQPGTESGRLVEDKESIVVAWQTNGVPTAFDVEYGPDASLGQKASVSKQERLGAHHKQGERRLNHVATLSVLQLHKRYHYRARMDGETLLEGYFTTRKPRGVKAR